MGCGRLYIQYYKYIPYYHDYSPQDWDLLGVVASYRVQVGIHSLHFVIVAQCPEKAVVTTVNAITQKHTCGCLQASEPQQSSTVGCHVNCNDCMVVNQD